jgi:hypothetical protein
MITEMDKFKRNVHPICGVCDKPVERFEQVEDFRTYTLIFLAYCHGQVERMNIDKDDLIDIHRNITGSRAFIEQVKLLENKE